MNSACIGHCNLVHILHAKQDQLNWIKSVLSNNPYQGIKDICIPVVSMKSSFRLKVIVDCMEAYEVNKECSMYKSMFISIV